jgi:hypothetical protein
VYIRGSNSPAAAFLFFLLYAISCIFPNTISFSLLSPVPGLPVLILVLPSPHVPVLITSSFCLSHTPVRIMKSRISRHTLYLCHIAVPPKSAAAPNPHLHPAASSLDSVSVPHPSVTRIGESGKAWGKLVLVCAASPNLLFMVISTIQLVVKLLIHAIRFLSNCA